MPISEILPVVIPFFGTALLIGCATTCCVWRRSQARILALSERVATLEARSAITPMPAPPPSPVLTAQQVYTAPYTLPPNFYPPRHLAYPVPLPQPPKAIAF